MVAKLTGGRRQIGLTFICVQRESYCCGGDGGGGNDLEKKNNCFLLHTAGEVGRITYNASAWLTGWILSNSPTYSNAGCKADDVYRQADNLKWWILEHIVVMSKGVGSDWKSGRSTSMTRESYVIFDAHSTTKFIYIYAQGSWKSTVQIGRNRMRTFLESRHRKQLKSSKTTSSQQAKPAKLNAIRWCALPLKHAYVSGTLKIASCAMSRETLIEHEPLLILQSINDGQCTWA